MRHCYLDTPLKIPIAWTSPAQGFVFRGRQAAEEIPGSAVTAAFFDIFGSTPAIGRAFLLGEDQAGRGPVVVVSDCNPGLFREVYENSRDSD
jgi:hypothetical protein